ETRRSRKQMSLPKASLISQPDADRSAGSGSVNKGSNAGTTKREEIDSLGGRFQWFFQHRNVSRPKSWARQNASTDGSPAAWTFDQLLPLLGAAARTPLLRHD